VSESYGLSDPAPKSGRPKWVVPVIAGLAVAVLVLGAVAVWALTRDRELTAPIVTATSSPAASTFILYGDVTLTLATAVLNLDGAECTGMNGLEDIREGADVTVTDAAGKTAVGELESGQLQGSGDTRTCRFPFHVDGVQHGRGPYRVKVSFRAEGSVSETVATAGVGIQIGAAG
jgi:hypothetical protein